MARNRRLELGFDAKVTGGSELERLRKQAEALNAATEKHTNVTGKSATVQREASAIHRKSAEEVQNLSDHIENLVRHIPGVNDRMFNFAKVLPQIFNPATLAIGGLTIGTAAAAVSLTHLILEEGKVAQHTLRLGEHLGLGARQTHALTLAAEAARVNVSALASAVASLPTSKLQELGVETTNLSGRQRDSGAILTDILGKLNQYPEGLERSAVASRTFGSALGTELVALSRQNQEFGRSLDENAIRGLAKAADEADKLKRSWDLTKQALAAKIAPILIPVTVAITRTITGEGVPDQARRFTVAGATEGSQAPSLSFDSREIVRQALAQSGTSPFGFIGEDLARGQRLSSGFRANTELGRRLNLEQLRTRLADIAQRLGSQTITGTAFDTLNRERLEIERQVKAIEDALKPDTSGTLKLSDLQRPGGFRRPGLPPSLLPPGTPRGVTSSIFTADFTKQDAEEQRLEQERTKAFGQGLLDRGKRDRETAVKLAQQELEARVRIVELTAGPGGELTAAQKIYDLRIAAAQTEEERQRAALDFQVKIAEARKAQLERQRQEIENFKRGAEQLFDALTSRGAGGLRSFVLSQGLNVGRTLTGNIASELFTTLRGAGAGNLIPGQTGSDGRLTTIGRILQGTPFGVDPTRGLAQATLTNTTATVQNTQALQQLSVAVGGGLPGGSIGGIPGIPGGVFQGAGLNPLIFSAIGGRSGTSNIFDLPLNTTRANPGTFGLPFPLPATNTSNATLNNVGRGAAVAAGAFGVYSGLRQGGAQGGLTAASSALGTAALLSPEPISKAVLAAASAVAGLGAAILGDPKEKRGRDIERFFDSNRYTDPTVLENEFTASGRRFDYNSRGEVRVINEFHINAIDSQSFLDHRNEISDAVRMSFQEGHPVLDEGRELMIGR